MNLPHGARNIEYIDYVFWQILPYRLAGGEERGGSPDINVCRACKADILGELYLLSL